MTTFDRFGRQVDKPYSPLHCPGGEDGIEVLALGRSSSWIDFVSVIGYVDGYRPIETRSVGHLYLSCHSTQSGAAGARMTSWVSTPIQLA